MSNYDDGDKIYEVLTTKKDIYGYNFQDVLKWFYREQSQFLLKSIVLEMNSGVVGTNIFTWLDGKPNKLMVGWIKNWQISGLRDGNFLPAINVGKPRPVYFTYKLIIEKLQQVVAVEKIEFEGKNVRAFKFLKKSGQLHVFWYDDGIEKKPGQLEASTTIDLSPVFGEKSIKVTNIITIHGQTSPEIEIVPANSVFIKETPIFVELE